MITAPRCSRPVRNYQLRRLPDKMDVALRDGSATVPCYRPRGHPGDRHLSEAAVRRGQEQNRARRQAVRQAPRGNDRPRWQAGAMTDQVSGRPEDQGAGDG